MDHSQALMQPCPAVRRAFQAVSELPDRELVLRIMRQVLQGLRHVHACGYLHLE